MPQTIQLNIEGQHTQTCFNPGERRLQEVMPAALEGKLSESAWKDIGRGMNRALAETAGRLQLFMKMRAALMILPAVTLILVLVHVYKLIIGEKDPAHAARDEEPGFIIPVNNLGFGIPLVFLVLMLAGGKYCLRNRMRSIIKEGVEKMQKVCTEASNTNPGLTFVLKDEWGHMHLRLPCYVEVTLPDTTVVQAIIVDPTTVGNVECLT